MRTPMHSRATTVTDECHRQFVFDAKAESRLCRKIDLFIVPTVSLLYLFCFIDRANIGRRAQETPCGQRHC